MIIGHFVYDAAGCYAGNVTTLSLRHNAVRFTPAIKSGDREPDYRIMAETPLGPVEFGAAWKRTSDKGQNFLSVALDDPSLAGALNAALFPAGDGETAVLVWNRAKPNPPASTTLKVVPNSAKAA